MEDISREAQKEKNPDLSNTLDVDFARKAVGNLFDKEDKKEAIMAGYNDFTDEPANEQEEPEEQEEPVVRPKAVSTPEPKPAIKVDASVQTTSRSPLRVKYDSQEYEEHAEQEYEQQEQDRKPRPQKAQPVKSRYVFIDEEEDEFTEFRRRYKPRDIRKQEDSHMPEEPPAKARRQAQVRPKIEDEPPAAKKSRPPARKRHFPMEPQDTYVETGLPNFVKVTLVALMVILLMMMVFLIYRHMVINSQLEDANIRLLRVSELEQELSQATIDIEIFEERIAELEAENTRLLAMVNVPQENITYPAEGYPPEGAAVEAPYVPAAPAAPGTDRIHTVVAGDNLSRIARQYFGSDSPANIQRIIAANDLPNPDNLVVGQTLVIPH